MPELKEILNEFKTKNLLIHLQNGDLETAEILWDYIKEMSSERLSQITIYGGHEEMMFLRKQNSEIRVLSMKLLKNSLIKYELVGWTGYVPKQMRNMELHIPNKFAKYLWGWPNKFTQRMASVNTNVVLVEGNGKASEGFDSIESLDNIAEGFSGYVWSNRVDIISQSKKD